MIANLMSQREEVKSTLQSLLTGRSDSHFELRELPEKWGMYGISDSLYETAEKIEKLARRPYLPVMIIGQTGTGKELVARAIHRATKEYRKTLGEPTKEFIPANCSCFIPALAPSQLFGHVRGAFTGAEISSLGCIGCADEGTLLLDEFPSLPAEIQPMLLRFLDQDENGYMYYNKMGRPSKIDKTRQRVLATSNVNIEKIIAGGKLRRDLAARFSQRIYVPELKERLDDIPIIAEHTLRVISGIENTPTYFTVGAVNALRGYGWPDNVRQLKGVIESACLESDGRTITEKDISKALSYQPKPLEQIYSENSTISGEVISLNDAEEFAIRNAMKAANNNVPEAAALLHIHRTTLWRKLKEHKLLHLGR